MRILVPLIACFIVTFASIPARAQTQSVFDQESLKVAGALSAEQQLTLRARRELIVGEAANLPANEWAGTYVAEDSPTSGTQFDWAPANGFLVWWNSCSHGWRDRANFGRVDFREGVLRVTPELGSQGDKVFALHGELIPVKWGEQHYLVPLDQLIAFCYAARNAGRSLEIKEFLLKQSDREKRRFGLPAVPVEYKKYLVGPAIRATIVELKSEPGRKVFSLNAGRTAGVVSGMKFFALTPRNVYMLVEVSAVREDSSEAYVVTSGFKNHARGDVKPRVGWKLTSRAPRRAYEYFPG
jgi:hypothetical protein